MIQHRCVFGTKLQGLGHGIQSIGVASHGIKNPRIRIQVRGVIRFNFKGPTAHAQGSVQFLVTDTQIIGIIIKNQSVARLNLERIAVVFVREKVVLLLMVKVS